MTQRWPELGYVDWRETCSALHLYLQVAGKYRLAHTPWLNHSWHATFTVAGRGWTSSLIPDGPGIEIVFDLIDHRVIGQSADGLLRFATLRPLVGRGFRWIGKNTIGRRKGLSCGILRCLRRSDRRSSEE